MGCILLLYPRSNGNGAGLALKTWCINQANVGTVDRGDIFLYFVGKRPKAFATQPDLARHLFDELPPLKDNIS